MSRPDQRLVVGLLDEVGDVAGTAASAYRNDDHLVLVHRVGREAAGSLVDTGETEMAATRFASASRRWPGRADLRLGSGPADALVAEVVDGRPPDLLVRGATTGWTWRLAMRRSLALGAALGIPILHAPGHSADERVLVRSNARHA